MKRYRERKGSVSLCKKLLKVLEGCPGMVGRQTNSKRVEVAIRCYLERYSEDLEYQFKRQTRGYEEDRILYIPIKESDLDGLKQHLVDYVGYASQEMVVGAVVKILESWAENRRKGVFRSRKPDDGLDGLEPIG